MILTAQMRDTERRELEEQGQRALGGLRFDMAVEGSGVGPSWG